MEKFIGRQHELQMLSEQPRHKANLVVLRGRRRIGKSRLAAEFAKGKIFLSFSGVPPQEGTTAQDQLDEFARQFYSHFKLPPITFKNWSDAFANLTDRLTQEPTVILLDEISWMGNEDLLFVGKLKNWWDLHLQKYPNLTLILCGSVSIWIEENIINSTALFGRISLFLYLEELSIAESYEFLRHLNFKGSDYDVFKILSVTGGVPWYLEQVSPLLLADENIRNLCFLKEGLLTHEFDRIFTDLFDVRGAIYKKIVQALSDGMKTLAELRTTLGYKQGGVLGRYLKDLFKAGFISVDNTWSFKSKKEGKQSLYRLSDNYLRFYIKYIEPNLGRINKNTFLNLPLSDLLGWDSIMGLQVENLILKNRQTLLKKIGVLPQDIVNENPYIQKQTKQHRGCQVDYLIQTKANNLIVCEFKFQNRNVGNEVIDAIKEKVKRLSIPRGFGVAPVLVHMGGVSDSVVESQYFYRIIDLRDWLEE
ncbi:MAG: ATP-binding protein [Proteobacteria bacterium]|nr:ATP-binding protein [Pseudomonadota bacterium]